LRDLDERLGELADELAGFGERLADLALELLQGAAADHDQASGEAARALQLERRVTRARRSVNKAVSLLAASPPERDASEV
jgi:hypothetical protein